MLFKKNKNSPIAQRQPSRTLGVSKRSKFSYYDSRAPREAQPIRRPSEQPTSTVLKDRAKKRSPVPTVFVSVIIAVLLIDILWLETSPRVIVDEPNNAAAQLLIRPTDIYERAAQKLFAASAGNRTKVTINTAAIDMRMQREFPELSNVSITLPLFGHQPTLYLDPTTPVAILNVQPSDYYLISPTGIILKNLPLTTVNVLKLPIVTDQNNLNVAIGQPVLVESDISFIDTVIAQLQAYKIGISSLTIPQGTRELDVHLQNVPYYVEFNLNDGSTDMSQQIGTFLATRKYLIAQNITPAQYINAQVPGRVYYK